jgi:predicted MFS family arabinose efflux permease
MSAALAATALGGLYLATFPCARGLAWLYAYWGVTTILFFWAAMLRAVREWGGPLAQGRAFGWLDGGRGLVAALAASAMVALFVLLAPGDDLAPAARRAALVAIILAYSAATLASALWIWRALPRHTLAAPSAWQLRDIVAVVRLPAVWLQALIVVCAYCAYKGLDNYALYARDALGASEAYAASLAASGAYVRPLAAVAAGYCADRCGVSRVIVGLFGVLVIAYAALATLNTAWTVLLYANIVISFAAVFALRGVYFALTSVARVPLFATGTAIGVVSVIGYTPDIFFAAVAGRLLDRTPGIGGHHDYFVLLAVIAIIGCTAAFALAHATSGRDSRP